MKFCSIASGSSGNCIYAGSSETSVLIDAGISGKRIEQGLNSIEQSTLDINGILVTHEHSDHIKGLGVLARRYGIPVYGTKGTLDALKEMTSIGKLPETLLHTVKADDPFFYRRSGDSSFHDLPRRRRAGRVQDLPQRPVLRRRHGYGLLRRVYGEGADWS